MSDIKFVIIILTNIFTLKKTKKKNNLDQRGNKLRRKENSTNKKLVLV